MIINHNIPALTAHRQMGVNQSATQNSLEKLSTGLRINKAGDDAAGLAISEKMRAQIRGLEQGARNAQDGVSLIQTAEGALTETHAMLQRMRELAVQANNDTNDAGEKEKLQAEVDQLLEEIDRSATASKFNGMSLFDGDTDISEAQDGSLEGKTFNFQIGANNGDSISINVRNMSAESIITEADGTALDIDITAADTDGTGSGAEKAIDAIDRAIETVSKERASLGAYQNRFEHTINNLNVSAENLTAAESRIRDTDYDLAAA